MTPLVSRTLCAALAALACDGATAAIVAAPEAPAAHRPTIDAGGGATRIDIAAPNAAGVSLNQYSRFDVDAAGAVLNNAVDGARSDLLGDIAGNAALRGNAARLIVNQVLGNEPSTLRGMLEVAGARAGVVVANPHGIECDGCGFIGSGRVLLLAGDAKLDGPHGALGTLITTDGTLRIGAGGLREAARAASHIDLIARRIAIAGRIDAQSLQVATGANRINDPTGDTQVMATSSPPALALDVAAAGAMHAGRIHLIATEAGAGVRSTGVLHAHVHDLRIDSAGALHITRAQARRDLVLEAHDAIDLAEAVDAGRDLEVRGAALQNGGTTSADGTLRIDVGELHNIGGTLRAGHDLQLASRGTVGNTLGGTMQAGGELRATVRGDLDNAAGEIRGARVRLELGNRLDNVNAQLQATHGALDISAQFVDNRGGDIDAGAALHVRLPMQGTLNNAGGHLKARAGAMRLASGYIGNARGDIKARQALQLSAAHVANGTGSITAGGPMHVDCRSTFDNSGALLQSGQGLALGVGQDVDNDYGMIVSSDDMQLALGRSLSNLGGRIESAQGGLRLYGPASDVDNTGGDIAVGRKLALDVATLSNGRRGRVSGDYLELELYRLDNRGGRIAAQHAMDVTAEVIENGGGGRLSAAGNAALNIGARLDNSGGRIKVLGSELALHAPNAEVDNRGGELRMPLGTLRANTQTIHGELRLTQP